MLTIQIKNWYNEIVATIGNIFSLEVNDEVNKGWKLKIRFPAEKRLRKQPLQKWHRVSVYYWLKIWNVINLFEWYITDITLKTTEVVLEAENRLSYLQNRMVRAKKTYSNAQIKDVISGVFTELNNTSELPIVLWLNDDTTTITKDFDVWTSFYDILKYCRTSNPKLICRIVNSGNYHFLECSENAGKVLDWVWEYDAKDTRWTNIVDWSRKDSMDKFYAYIQSDAGSIINEDFIDRTRLLFEKYDKDWTLALPNGIAIPSIAISRDTDWWDFTPWDRKNISIITWYDWLPLWYLWLIQSRKVTINAKGWIKTEIKVSDEYKSDTNILDLVLQNLRWRKTWGDWEMPDMSNYYTKEGTNQAISVAVSGKANVNHTHLVQDITNFADSVGALINTALGDYITSGDLQTALSWYSQTGHTHTTSDITWLDSALSDKANAVHSHTVSDITDFQSAVASAISWKADTNHTHTISDVSWLQTALDNKASSVHSHTIAQITGLQDALNSKANSSDVYSKSQVYTKTEVDNLIPTVPTVNDSTITIQVNWTTIKSITLNQANWETINIPVPTKTSDLNNDSWFITKAVSDLTNYYTKTQTYTKTEVDNMISNFWWFEVVSTLPTTNIKTNVIYLKWPIGTWSDRYEEWIYYSNTWTMIGETSVDLTNYFNVSTDTADRITEWSSHLFMTTAERSKLSWIEAQAQKNTITWVKWDDESSYRTGNVNITKANIWLWNVNNTSDADKPISTATQNALDLKMNKAEKRLFVITEDMVTVTQTATKWVSPYNTSYYYTDITINANAWVQRVEWAFYYFEVNTTMVVASAYRNVRVRIWDWAYIPMKNRANSILAWNSYMAKWRTDFFVYKTIYESWWALHLNTDTSYSAMSVAEWQTWTDTSWRVVRADYLKQIIKYHSVDDTAFANSWDGQTDIAPSKNAVYDKLSAMDTTIWTKANDSDVVKKTGNQTINWTKTYTTSPVVPSKSTDAGDNPTTIATEKQVKNVADSIGKWTLTLTYDWDTLGTFNANATANKTIAIPVWSSINELTENFVRTMIQAWIGDYDNVFRASSWLYRILNALDEKDNLWLTEWEVREDIVSNSTSMSMISHSYSAMVAVASSKVAMDEILSSNSATKEVSECWNSICVIAESSLASDLYLSSEYWITNLFTYQTAQDAFFSDPEKKQQIVSEYIMTIVNNNTLLSNLYTDTVVANAIANSQEAMDTIASSWTKLNIVKTSSTIMTAIATNSSALGNMSNNDFTTYILENSTYLTTTTSSTAGQNRINSMSADSLLPAIYYWTWLSWYASFQALSEDDNAVEILEDSTEAMSIVECNDEAMNYLWYAMNQNTICYFPFKNDLTDKAWNRTLTVNGCTISDWVVNIPSYDSYMKLNNTIWGSQITISVWYYLSQFNWQSQSRHTLFCRDWWTYHHFLFPNSTRSWQTQWNVGFYNSSWYASSKILSVWNWYHIVVVKNWSNEKIYINDELVMDSNSSFNNDSYPLWIIANYSSSWWNQGAVWKMSDLIIESWNRTASDVDKYFNRVYKRYLWSYKREKSSDTIAYYPLTASSTVNDLSWNSLNWTKTWNITFWSWLNGVDCWYFPWSSSYITIPNDSKLNPTQLTISMRVASKDYNGNRWILYKWPFSWTNWIYCIANYQNLDWRIWETSHYSSAFPSNDKWIHVVVTYDWTTWKVYRNWELMTTFTQSASFSWNTNNLYLWAYWSSSYCFYWYISRVIMEKRIWTKDEAMWDYLYTRANYLN